MNNSPAKLSYSQIQTIAEQLQSSAGNMETLLSEIKALFEKIGTDDVWSGTAAANTKAEFDKLSGKFPEFSQSVNDCHAHLMNVLERYKAVDNTISGN